MPRNEMQVAGPSSFSAEIGMSSSAHRAKNVCCSDAHSSDAGGGGGGGGGQGQKVVQVMERYAVSYSTKTPTPVYQ